MYRISRSIADMGSATLRHGQISVEMRWKKAFASRHALSSNLLPLYTAKMGAQKGKQKAHVSPTTSTSSPESAEGPSHEAPASGLRRRLATKINFDHVPDEVSVRLRKKVR